MTEDFDFYDLLEISAEASQDDIKQAFREQVRIYHPDLNDDDRAQAQFTALKKAYDILGDPVERKAYDRLGHEDYVAKRTKGLPSPDLWKKKATKTQRPSESERAEDSTRSTSSASTGGETTSRTTTSRSSTSTTASAGAGTSSATSTSHASESTRAGGVGSTDGGTTARTGVGTGTVGSTGASGTRSHTRAGRTSDNAALRWWRNRNVAWPLIWLSTATYVAGLVHFGLEHTGALGSLGSELAAIGADPVRVWEMLVSGRHGLETTAGFVSATELVIPPLPELQWYGVLAGIVLVAVLSLLGARLAWREDTWGRLTLDETLVVALALGLSSVLFGGPLLAGALLMPLLFGVIVHRTHQLPGWSPSYLFVLAVSAPAVALVAGAAGYASLPADVVAFVVLPLAGAFGLPLRASVRKRLGR